MDKVIVESYVDLQHMLLRKFPNVSLQEIYDFEDISKVTETISSIESVPEETFIVLSTKFLTSEVFSVKQQKLAAAFIKHPAAPTEVVLYLLSKVKSFTDKEELKYLENWALRSFHNRSETCPVNAVYTIVYLEGRYYIDAYAALVRRKVSLPDLNITVVSSFYEEDQTYLVDQLAKSMHLEKVLQIFSEPKIKRVYVEEDYALYTTIVFAVRKTLLETEGSVDERFNRLWEKLLPLLSAKAPVATTSCLETRVELLVSLVPPGVAEELPDVWFEKISSFYKARLNGRDFRDIVSSGFSKENLDDVEAVQNILFNSTDFFVNDTNNRDFMSTLEDVYYAANVTTSEDFVRMFEGKNPLGRGIDEIWFECLLKDPYVCTYTRFYRAGLVKAAMCGYSVAEHLDRLPFLKTMEDFLYEDAGHQEWLEKNIFSDPEAADWFKDAVELYTSVDRAVVESLDQVDVNNEKLSFLKVKTLVRSLEKKKQAAMKRTVNSGVGRG